MSPQLLADREQAVLVDFDTAYYPTGDPTDWSTLEQEAFEARVRALHLVRETLPVRPRKASAHKRRQRHARLAYEISLLAPGAVTVLVTPVWMTGMADGERTYMAVARDTGGEQIRRSPGAGLRITALLQAVWPCADWDRPQTWHADTNRLAVFAPVTPAELAAA